MEALEQMYLEHDAFQARALEWDRNQQLMIAAYEKKKKEIDAENAEKLLEEGQPEVWDKQKERLTTEERIDLHDGESLVFMSEIDKMEQAWTEEFHYIMQKDRERNKDLNKHFQDQFTSKKHFFNYLRTQEKLYQYDKQVKKI